MTNPSTEEPDDTSGSTSPVKSTALAFAAIIRWWAILGGLLVSGLALMTAYSAASKLLVGVPFSPDYELSKHIMAIAIFTFLPYCQLMGANVTVDIFTEGLSASKKALMSVLSALFALAFSILLLRQMSYGFEGYLKYPEITPVLGLPLWTAFPPILFSLALLLAASLITLNDAVRVIRSKRPWIDLGGVQPSE